MRKILQSVEISKKKYFLFVFISDILLLPVWFLSSNLFAVFLHSMNISTNCAYHAGFILVMFVAFLVYALSEKNYHATLKLLQRLQRKE